MHHSRYIVAWWVILALAVASAATWQARPQRRDLVEPVATGFRINVNTDDPATLSLLSGISEKLGAAIVEHREAHGPFRSAADLDAVPRLGPVTIEKIAPYIEFGVD